MFLFLLRRSIPVMGQRYTLLLLLVVLLLLLLFVLMLLLFLFPSSPGKANVEARISGEADCSHTRVAPFKYIPDSAQNTSRRLKLSPAEGSFIIASHSHAPPFTPHKGGDFIT